jgi:chromosome segregation ATPase
MTQPEQRLQTSIDSKIRALDGLTSQLNVKRDEYLRSVQELDDLLNIKRDEVYHKLAEWEKLQHEPKKGIDAIKADLDQRERQLAEWKNELDTADLTLVDWEQMLNEREKLVDDALESVSIAWMDFIQHYSKQVTTDFNIIEKRAEMLTKRTEMINTKERRLNDQIRTFKSAQNEILARNNNG